MSRNKVVLVDKDDNEIGEMDKLEAHQKGILHRAFSVFIFDEKGEMLIHQRADSKYHGGGLWSNACCSHPQLNEDVKQSAEDRLKFEMGIECDLAYRFSFVYHTPVENDLIEHEFDHVFSGIVTSTPKPNAEEVKDFRWISIADLQKDLEINGDQYTFWFKKAVPTILRNI